MANLKQKFRTKLQTLRKASRLTQAQIAQKTGLTIESISNIEREVHGPNMKVCNAPLLQGGNNLECG